MKEVTEEKIDKYLGITDEALRRITAKKGLAQGLDDMPKLFLDMIRRYLSDAKHYKEKGDYVTAFAAVNYAHGWLDSGVKVGLFDVEEGSESYVMPSG